ncbi:serine/threonine protein kinase [Paenibacillus sp. 1_12]|uniref:protein kinase domain-containing protein n=1 Tax=Paenibacillus sp. 1_12 TaxID=1566278 RepID=UPI0008E60A8F|nr:serine/threonine protein kinase [Paenibacillus sp. 1_12]SFM31632.1 serine/threonine protein kinase [Paenibacillus sp. 1_12]
MITSFDQIIQSDTVLNGKWNKTLYQVERLLGEGANGKVYLVKRGKRQYALKIGLDAADLQSEVNALKVLSKSNTSFENYLLDVDDFHHQGVDYPFYVMRYIKGQTISDFVRQNGRDWVGLIGLNMLRKLVELHEQGYVFGDIKVQNMLVCGYGDVELIDFGGVTAKGRSVKQFTEVYDRGYWGAGTRTADEGYDMFAFAMLLISSTETEQRMHGIDKLLPQNRSVHILIDLLKSNPILEPCMPVLQKALLGHYTSSKQVLAAWRRLSFHKHPPASSASRESWLKLGFTASLLFFGLAVYFYWT